MRLAISALLFLLNFAICREIFHTAYTRHMGSIEGAFIGISRLLIAHPQSWNWFPWWYCGIPWQNTYPPLLHLLVAAAAPLFHGSAAISHHAVSGLFYCLGPVAVFLLAESLSKDWKASLGAALLFSLVSPSAFLMRQVHGDLHSFQLPRRFQTLVIYGEGPHVTSLTLLILALFFLHRAVEKRTAASIGLTALAFAAVAATNWLGAFALALAVLSYVFAERRALATALLSGVLGYGLVAPWLPPSTILAVQRNAQFTVGSYPMGATQAIYAVTLGLALIGLSWVLNRCDVPTGMRFAANFLLLTAGIALPSDWFHVYLMPQPERYHLEMEFALVMVLAFVSPALLRRVPRWASVSVLVVLLALGVVQFGKYRRYARAELKPIDIQQTVEHEAANWFQNNLPGKRVFATGSTRFWLSAFADNPQVGGGFDQGIVDRENPVMTYGIPFMKGDGPISAMWLRIVGANGVFVDGKNGRDAYKDWQDPDKYRGVLPEVWRNGDDAIFGVPVRSDSLVHAIGKSAVVTRPPVNVLDIEQARALDSSLSDSSLPMTPVYRQSDSEIRASGTLRPGQVFYVQASYHPGWHAKVNSVTMPIAADGMGFMVIDPQCDGNCDLQLYYDGGLEMTIAKLIRAAAILVLAIMLFQAPLRALWNTRSQSSAVAPASAGA